MFDYDAGGRLWHTTAQDGIDRYYVYDKAGNQTLTLASAGANLAGLTLANYTASLTGSGGTSTANAVTTITVYDRRGQATAMRAPDRVLVTGGSATTIVTGRSYTAFGEVASDTDARGYATTYTYNNMGRMLSKVMPQVSVTAENGTAATVNPTEYYGYDLSGRLVSMTDANGKRTARLLLAGSGHGGPDPLVTSEFHPDSGVAQTKYDVFGDARILRNELFTGTNQTTSDQVQTFDKLGRLTTLVHRGAVLTDTYAYDLLGQRLSDTQSYSGGSQAATTDYDAQGRVVRTQAFAAAGSGMSGDVTTTAYDWSGSLRRQTVTYAAGTAGARTTVDTSDTFGRVMTHKDMGNVTTTVSYDLAGRMTERATPAAYGNIETQRYTWLNTGQLATISSGNSYSGTYYEVSKASYGYNANGAKVTEAATNWNTTVENAIVNYDALGRMTDWTETGTLLAGTSATLNPAASVAWQYDAVGNVRRQADTYWLLNGDGSVWTSQGQQARVSWYRYDAMNRVVTDGGTLTGGAIVRGSSGVDLTYDLAGRRNTATTTKWLDATVEVWVQNPNTPRQYDDPDSGHWETQQRSYQGANVETYAYDAAGNLASAAITATNYYDDGNGNAVSTGVIDRAMGGGTFSYDVLGRQVHQVDTVEGGASVYDHALSYDAKGRVYYDAVTQRQGSDTVTTNTSNSFADGTASYALGAVTGVTTSGYRLVGGYTYQSSPNTSTTQNYAWYDGAVLSSVYYTVGSSTQHTDYVNTATGTFVSATVYDGRQRTISVTNDVLGQALRRDEADNISWNPTTYAGGDPHEGWYRFDGKQLGYTGNDGTYDTSYAGSLADRTHTVWGGNGAFRYGSTLGMANADFNDRLTPINSWAQGSSGGSYTVRTGDTLASIAAQLWGDAGLWYKLAEANGLGANTSLSAGQTLVVPAGVVKNADSSSTFKPYDVSQAYGDTSPTTPQPQAAPKKNKCGIFGQILLIAIAVAVTIASHGALAHFIGVAAAPATATAAATVATGLTASIGVVGATAVGGAIAAVAGSVVSQLVGLATGIQDKFSWKGVALAAISGAIGGGLGKVAGLNGATGLAGVAQGAARGAIGSVLTQGIAVATGLQKKFDFVGVAAAGIAAGASGAAALKLHLPESFGADVGQRLITGVAGAIADATTRSLVNGSDFGDNLMAALPDVIGQTIGGMVGDKIAGKLDYKQNKIDGDKRRKAIRDARAPAATSGTDGAPSGGDIVITGSRKLLTPSEQAAVDARNKQRDADSAAGLLDPPDKTYTGSGSFPMAASGQYDTGLTADARQVALGVDPGSEHLRIKYSDPRFAGKELKYSWSYSDSDPSARYVFTDLSGKTYAWSGGTLKIASMGVTLGIVTREQEMAELQQFQQQQRVAAAAAAAAEAAARPKPTPGYYGLYSFANDSLNWVSNKVSPYISPYYNKAAGYVTSAIDWGVRHDPRAMFADFIGDPRGAAIIRGVDRGVIGFAGDTLGGLASLPRNLIRKGADIEANPDKYSLKAWVNWIDPVNSDKPLHVVDGLRKWYGDFTSSDLTRVEGATATATKFTLNVAATVAPGIDGVRALAITSDLAATTRVASVASDFGIAADSAGVDLIASRPSILSDTSLPAADLAYVTKQFARKEASILRASDRGELVFSPGTSSVRIESLQAAYRDSVASRYESLYGRPLDLSRLNADHPIDLIVGGSPTQSLRMLNESVNKSVGSSLRQAAKRAGLQPGAPIRSITFR